MVKGTGKSLYLVTQVIMSGAGSLKWSHILLNMWCRKFIWYRKNSYVGYPSHSEGAESL